LKPIEINTKHSVTNILEAGIFGSPVARPALGAVPTPPTAWGSSRGSMEPPQLPSFPCGDMKGDANLSVAAARPPGALLTIPYTGGASIAVDPCPSTSDALDIDNFDVGDRILEDDAKDAASASDARDIDNFDAEDRNLEDDAKDAASTSDACDINNLDVGDRDLKEEAQDAANYCSSNSSSTSQRKMAMNAIIRAFNNGIVSLDALVLVGLERIAPDINNEAELLGWEALIRTELELRKAAFGLSNHDPFNGDSDHPRESGDEEEADALYTSSDSDQFASVIEGASDADEAPRRWACNAALRQRVCTQEQGQH